MDLTLPIQDARVKIIPSTKLISFIKTLSEYDSMPENILRIYQNFTKDKNEKKIVVKEYKVQNFSENEEKILRKINENIDYSDKYFTNNEHVEPDDSNLKTKYVLLLNDLNWLNEVLKEKRETDEKSTENIYLHELISGCSLILPKNEIQERNPILEKRCKKLREEQDRFLYNKMTKGVDMSRRLLPEDTISYQLKQINKQLIAVAQFLFSVAAGFLFGFIGIELIVGNLDFGFRLLLGIMIALIIAIAEIYFLAKKLNEYDDDSLQKEILTVPQPGEKFKLE